MTAEAVIELIALVATVVTAAATSYLAYSALVFTARPKLELTLEDEPREHAPSDEVVLRIWLENVGHWYAAPAATDMLAYVNLDEECEPVRARLGLDLEDDEGHVDPAVRTGKGIGAGRSRYLVVRGINVVHGENGEVIELTVRTPPTAGRYRGWLVLLAREGDCGLHSFWVTVGSRATSQLEGADS